MFTLDQYTTITGKKTIPNGTIIRNTALPYALAYRVENHNPKTGVFSLYSETFPKRLLIYGLEDGRIMHYTAERPQTRRYTGKLNPVHWEIVELPAMPLPIKPLPVYASLSAYYLDKSMLKTLALDKTQTPKIDGLIIDAQNTSITLTRIAKNSETPIKVSIPAKVETPFKALIFSANGFIEWLQTYNELGEKLTFSLEDKRLEVKAIFETWADGTTKTEKIASVTRFTLGDLPAFLEAHAATLAGAEYPAAWVEVPFNEFKQSWQWMAEHTAKDDHRPILTGIYARIGLDGLTLAAVDGYRLAIKTLNPALAHVDGPTYALTLQPKNKSLGALLGYPLAKNSEYSLRIHLDDLHEYAVLDLIQDGQVCISAVVAAIEGKFPAYESIVPTKSSGQVCAYIDDLQRAIKRTLPYLERKSNPNVKLTITGPDYSAGTLGELHLSAYNAEKGELGAYVTTSGHDGANLTITLNAFNLLAALEYAGKVKKEKSITLAKDTGKKTRKTPATNPLKQLVTLKWQGETDPFIVMFDDGAKVVLMPVRKSPDVSNLPSKVPAPTPPAQAEKLDYTQFVLEGAMGCDGYRVRRVADNELMPTKIAETPDQARVFLAVYLGVNCTFTLLDEDGAILWPVQDNEWENGIESTPDEDLSICVTIQTEPHPLKNWRHFVAYRDYLGELVPLYQTHLTLQGLIDHVTHTTYPTAGELVIYHGGSIVYHRNANTILIPAPPPVPLPEPEPPADNSAGLIPSPDGLIFKPYDVLALDAVPNALDTCPQGLIYKPRDLAIYAARPALPSIPVPQRMAVSIAGALIVSSLLFGKVH